MLDWGRQYRQKLNAWVNTLHEQICTEVEPLTLMGSVLPDDQHGLPNETDYTRMPEGTPWGPKWSYGYFMTSFTVSSKMEGRRLVFMGGPGGETLVHVQGKARGSLDREHRYVLLTRCAKKGESFKLFMESYAGHGERLENIGPLTPESHALAPVPACQCTVQHSCVAIWDEDAYQLWMDVQTLTDLLSILPEKSLRAQKVAQGLYDFMQIVDFEQSLEQRDALYREAREHLSSLMTCQNGSTAPLMWLIGQSHIDLAWLWPMNETYHKAVRTYSNQVTLLDEYPTYRFLLCEPALLDMLQATDPELFAAIEGKVRNGQILPEGAFFVECDTNIPGGESLIRQLKWGKEWFEKLGVDTQVAWLPDCFGFSAALPQLLKGMHIPYFATQKLQRQDPECEGFPFHHFIWEGVDGSEVVALSFMKDNGPVSPKSFQERWETNRVQDRDIQVLLHPFGYGDGGGGPTRDMVESALRLRDLEGVPRSCWGGLREYFAYVTRTPVRNRYVGELYLAWHRGTWTSQRRTKALLRRTETMLHDTETLCALCGHISPSDEEILQHAWRNLLLCQFHDVAGGVGIERVHEDANRMLEQSCSMLHELQNQLIPRLYAIQEEPDMVTLVNTLGFPRQEWVKLPDGREVFAQVEAFSTVSLSPATPTNDAASKFPNDAVQVIESKEGWQVMHPLYSFRIDRSGQIRNLSGSSRESALQDEGQLMNEWRFYRNVQTVYDAWELDRDWPEQILPNAVESHADCVSQDTHGCEFRIIHTFGNSRAEELIRVRVGDPTIRCYVRVDWHERHKMLKVHFHSNLVTQDAIHEVQFGYVRRPTHSSTPSASDRYEVCQQRFSAIAEEERGFALLNDCIHGISSDRGELALTLLRAPQVPDENNNLGLHEMTFSIYPFMCSFAKSQTTELAVCLNTPLLAFTGRAESLAPPCRMISGNAMISTLMMDRGDMIIRVYNPLATRNSSRLQLNGTRKAAPCDLAGNEMEDAVLCNEIDMDLHAFEVRTYRLCNMHSAQ